MPGARGQLRQVDREHQVPHRPVDQFDHRPPLEAAEVLPFDRPAERLFQREVQHQQVAEGRVIPTRRTRRRAVQRLPQVVAGGGHGARKFFGGRLPAVHVENAVEFLRQPCGHAPPGGGNRALQVRAGVDGLDDPQKVIEVAHQRVLAVGIVFGIAADRTLETLQPPARDASRLQRLIEPVAIAAAVQESEVGLADHDVVGRGVVVQLLVPFFEEQAMHLLDMVAVHDLQDLVPDPLAVAAAPERGEHPAGPDANAGRSVQGTRYSGSRRIVPPDFGQAGRKPVLGVTQLARLGVVVPLPVELPRGAITQPDEQEGHGFRIVRARSRRSWQRLKRCIKVQEPPLISAATIASAKGWSCGESCGWPGAGANKGTNRSLRCRLSHWPLPG